MLSTTSLAGILGLIFGPPVLIFFSVMALKMYLRISSNEEALNEVRTTMQARRSRQILGLEGGSQALGQSDSILDIDELINTQTRQTREERIKDCINVFTVPESSSAFLRFATSESDPVSEMEDSARFSSSQIPTNTSIGTTTPITPLAPASVLSAQSQATFKSQMSQKSQTSRKSQKSRSSIKSKGTQQSKSSRKSSSTAARVSSPRVSIAARQSIDSFVGRFLQTRKGTVGDVCNICMDGYRRGDNVCKTRCNHVFHKECLEEWMKKHNRCPLCRNDLFRG